MAYHVCLCGFIPIHWDGLAVSSRFFPNAKIHEYEFERHQFSDAFSVTLIDYPTALVSNSLIMGNVADMRVAFIYYDLVALFISLTFAWLYSYVRHHPELTQMKKDQQHFYQAIKFDPIRSVLIYGLAIVATFFSIWLGTFLLLAGIVYHFLAYLRLSKSMRHALKVSK